MPRLYQQVDQQVDLLQSDAWVDAEIANREVDLKIKVMLLEGKISEAQWMNRNQAPEGVSAVGWRTFLEEHSRVRYSHIVAPINLRKSIANDRNFIAFLKSYRSKTRQELAQPHHVDFRVGGPFNRDVARKYGKPYDTMFMRMLTWSQSSQEGAWEMYIPGSTVKGAFRKRASQVLKTLWGESPCVTEVIDYLFGRQGQRGAVYFSDAYLADPTQPEKNWCSMDGVRMYLATARPGHDHRVDRFQERPRPRGEDEEERLRRRDEDVGRVTEHPRALLGRGVAGADGDIGEVHRLAAAAGHAGDAGDRRPQVALDIPVRALSGET